ncbi:MAG TPA: TonB-dependent receptor [Verrucomicrobiae bacterium]|jgi:iron complex outermembrane receptor protein
MKAAYLKFQWNDRNFWPNCPSASLAMMAVMIALAPDAPGQAQEALPPPNVLKKLSMEELINIEVITVSKRPERLSETASAIQVLTQEDILRSGASSIPEALRLAPNLQVAQVNSHDWAVSSRGFNNTVANKLLVMIDGRTIYTPLYAGVFWDVQNVLLEDVDRIEVVSGPGGTLWGANAVNGVINVVTKSAKDTQGALVTAGGGSLLQDFGAIRYGGSAGSNLFFRVYGQRFDRNNTDFPNGREGTNAWDMTQGGFRMDWYPSDANTLTLQGDAYSGTERGVTADTTVDGENVLGRWKHALSAESDLQVQMYFDRTWRRVPGTFAEDLETYDMDFQHRFPLGERQSVVWGAGYRLMQDDVKNGVVLAFLPARRDLQLFSGFVQDEVTLVPARLKLTVGTKLEHNDFSGLEVQPSGRLSWTPDDRQTLWAAVSRAIRSPSRIDADLFVPASPPFVLVGGTNFDSEKLIAYELGYRVRPCNTLTLSLAGFYNQYDDLRSLNRISPTTQVLANDFEGETWGVELSGNWQATGWWRLRGGYTFLHKDLRPKTANANPSVREGNDPEHQFLLQSVMDLPAHFQFDVTARYVDLLPSPVVPGYFSCDVRLAWSWNSRVELSVVGQNLSDNRHPEFGAPATRQEIPRSVYGKVTWRF